MNSVFQQSTLAAAFPLKGMKMGRGRAGGRGGAFGEETVLRGRKKKIDTLTHFFSPNKTNIPGDISNSSLSCMRLHPRTIIKNRNL